ncbi:SSI family serine proteinase inhibitor [Nonomuraea maritima]|uniref:SSI family serine proteinase inhibitor n=1 Tax=Nonomuraea maritima TaxID=683260 RepID=UPI0037100596
MTQSIGRRLTALGLCAAATLAVPFATGTAEAKKKRAPAAVLTITVTPGNSGTQWTPPQRYRSTRWTHSRHRSMHWPRHDHRHVGAYTYTLTCGPDGGTHPRAHEACDALRQVRGNVQALNVNPGACVRLYSPVTVDIRGQWYGRPTAYRQQFSNRCVMDRKLGPVV